MSRKALFVATLLASLFVLDASVEAQGLAARTQPSRDGLYLQGGAWWNAHADGRPWFRAEVGLHLKRLTRADLYLQIPVMISSRHWPDGAGGRWGWFGMAVAPGVRGEWTLLNRKGDLAVFLEGGGGIMFYSWDYGTCGGVGCGNYYGSSDVFGILRTGAGVVYTAPFGLMVSFQPAGFGFALGSGYNQGAFYDGHFMVGYRWP